MILLELNELAMQNLLSIVIPLIVLFITLKHDKKQFRIQLKQQNIEHQENIEKMEHQHRDIIKQQFERNRVEAMPYLIIDKSDITISKEGNTLHFKILFTNKGNGTAIKLTGKYFSSSSAPNLCVMCETINAIYGCACPFDYKTDVLKVNNTSHMMLYQKLLNDDTSNHSDWVTFKIMFQDMYFNQYEQQFKFLFSDNTEDGSIEVHRVSVSSPEVCEQ